MPVSTGITTIQCPQCNQSLPPGAMRCQFCGADLSQIARPAHAVAHLRAQAKARSTAPHWKEIAFHILAGLWVLSALFELLQGSHVVPALSPTMGFGQYLLVVGAIDLILGIGMWTQNDLAMTIIKWRCILGLLNGLFGCLFAFAFQDKPGLMIAILVYNIFFLAFTGFQLYIISEFAD